MNIGVISYDYEPPVGGLGVVAKTFATAIPQALPGTTVTVFSPSPVGFMNVPRIASLRWRKSGGCPLFSLVLNVVIRSITKKHRLDVLHLHAGSGGVFLLFRPRCPLVVTAHHTYAQEARLLFRSQPFKRFWKKLLSYLERRTYVVADAISCVSSDTADALVSDYGIEREKITVIENPVDNLFFSDYGENPSAESDELVYVGRIEERKGIHVLLRAFAELAPRYSSLRLTLIGANYIGSELQTMLCSLGIEERVQCTGWLSQEQRILRMRSAAFAVVPSLLEGFGLVAAEAMSLGTPVIASSCPGLASLVEHLVSGLTFTSGSHTSLADRIAFALDHRSDTLSMARVARERARSRFRTSVQASAMATLLAQHARNSNK